MIDDDDDLFFDVLENSSEYSQEKLWLDVLNQVQILESEYVKYYELENFSHTVYDLVQVLMNLCNDLISRFKNDEPKVSIIQNHLSNANSFLEYVGSNDVDLVELSNNIDSLQEIIQLNNSLILDFKNVCEKLVEIRVDQTNETLVKFKDALMSERNHLNTILMKNQKICEKTFSIYPPDSKLNQKILSAFVCLSKSDFFVAIDVQPQSMGLDYFFSESIN